MNICKWKIRFKITKFLNCNNTWMVSISNKSFQKRVIYIFTDRIVTLYCWMSRFWTIFEKKAFKTFAVPFSVLMISSFLIRVILWLDLIFFDNIGLTIFQNVLLLQIFFSSKLLWYSLFVFLRSVTQWFFVSRNLFCFHYSYFWEICFSDLFLKVH